MSIPAAVRRAALQQRLAAQCDFATALAAAEDRVAQWTPLIARARAIGEAAAAGGLDELAARVAEAEAVLSPIAPAAKAHTVRCIGHAHIDMNWMWGWPETVAITCDTFRTVLALMDEFPDFVFAQSQASVYAIVRDHEPALLTRIRQRVKEGRWEVVAAHWVEGERNLAGGEALCRHLLYTRRLMRELFDLTPEDVPVDWAPDTFGHAATIPTIDVGGAVKYLYCCRTGTLDRPAVFWWRAPDGARLLVHRELNWYNSDTTPGLITKHLLDFRDRTGLKQWQLVYGVGDHGGGPTRRDLRQLAEMSEWPIFPRLRHARIGDFFQLLEREGARWPELAHELNFEFTGCYTSQTAIKRGNRLGETLVAAADAATELAARAVGHVTPPGPLREAWTDVLFSHFHDILPGSGVAATRHFFQGQLQRVQAVAGQARQQALRALAARIDTGAGVAMASGPAATTDPGFGAGVGRASDEVSAAAWVGDGPRPFVIVNPTAWPRRGLVTLTVWDGDASDGKRPADRAWTVVGADGAARTPQRISSGQYWGHDFVELALPVTSPAGGWTVVSARPDTTSAATSAGGAVLELVEDGGHGQRSNVPTGRLALSNERLIAVIDRRRGCLASLIDRATGAELAAPGAGFAALEVQRERPVRMSAWVLGDPDGLPSDLAVEAIEATERGPWRVAVAVRLRHGQSRFTVTYALTAGGDRLAIAIDGRWLEHGNERDGVPRLQMRFPSALTAPVARYEVPFGAVTRDHGDGREVPALRWAALDGAGAGGVRAGFALLNDGEHGHSLDAAGVLRLNLIRSSYDPDPLPEIGEHRIRLALVPYAGDAAVADLARWAAEHDQPLAAVATTCHAGPLPAETAGLSLDDPAAMVVAVKRGEDGTSLVVRLVETAGAAREIRLTVPRAVYGALAEAWCTDLLERRQGAATVAGDVVTVSLPAYGLATVAMRLG